MTVVNRVPTLKPRARCGFVREDKLGVQVRCTLIAGHDEGRPWRARNSPSRHFFTPPSAFDRHGEVRFSGRTYTMPRDIYRGYIDPFERQKARIEAFDRARKEALGGRPDSALSRVLRETVEQVRYV